ncbi:MAG: TIGR01777 family oxidoreductase [Flavisolibacter sp.]
MLTVLITGGTGLIGKALTRALVQKHYHVIILTRDIHKKASSANLSYAAWDIYRQHIDEEAIGKADCIIHLAGANVAEKKWTADRKTEIIESRVLSGKLLVKALREVPNKVKTVVSASAIGWYGADAQIPSAKPFVESLLPAQDFLGKVCEQWEDAIMPVNGLAKRLVIFRTGIVLSQEGGAYPVFKKTLSFGVASILGSGKQIISWVHIEDLVRIYLAALENDQWQGTYNAVSPEPVSNKTLIMTIAKEKNKLFIPVHVPDLLLKIILGEMSTEILKSTTVSSWKAEGEGFDFHFPTIEVAVRNLENR